MNWHSIAYVGSQLFKIPTYYSKTQFPISLLQFIQVCQNESFKFIDLATILNLDSINPQVYRADAAISGSAAFPPISEWADKRVTP
jgi:hypothetical protein